MKTIESKIIGTLTQHPQYPDWWGKESVKIPFFEDTNLSIVFMNFEPDKDPNYLKEADETLQNFLAKGDADRLEISHLVYQNCQDFIEAVGKEDFEEDLLNIQEPNEIWQFVSPNRIYLYRQAQNDIYLEISCACDWEEEHGLVLVFQQGKQITRVDAHG